MAQNVHITHIEDTWANILANADHGQLAIKNNATAELPYEELLWLNDDGTYIYAAAAQRRYDVGGGSWGFLDAQFDAVTVNDTSDGLLVAKYVKHLGDTDTLILFDDAEDKITVQAGGVTFVDFTEAAQDVVEFNSADADVDFIVNTDTADTLVIRGSDSVVAIGSASAPTWKTATYEAVLSMGAYAAIAADGDDALEIVLGAYHDVTDSRWETTGGTTSSRLTLFEGITVYADGNDGSGAPGDALSWLELYHAKVTAAGTGEFVVNDGGDNVDTRIEADAMAYAVFLDASADSGLGRVGFGTGSPDRMVHIERDTATTDAVQHLLRLTSTCSGTVADGFGVGIEFELENASIQATNYVAGSIEVVWEDESDGDSDMIFRVSDAGSAYEALRISAYNEGIILSRAATAIDWSANQASAYGIVDGNFSRLCAASSANGGMLVCGYSKGAASASIGIGINAYVENDPDDEGAVHVRGFKHNGSGSLTSIGAAGKVFAVENYSTQLFEILGDGGIWTSLPSGSTQPAGLTAGELWHDTDDHTVKVAV